MAPIAAERSIRIIQNCAHPAMAVHADRQRSSQVLVNLISNAIKYNHRDGPDCRLSATPVSFIPLVSLAPPLGPDRDRVS